MKTLSISMLMIASLCSAVHAETPVSGEVVYPRGSIGYDALVSGDNEQAIAQILGNERVSRSDPAKLINLGQAYARTGRTAEAARLFTTAMQKRDQIDLVLANGQVINSREAARQALIGLQTRVAAR